jgi:cytochrome c biogenesis protein CcmG, thiol:disulfide interchange protein DsbE
VDIGGSLSRPEMTDAPTVRKEARRRGPSDRFFKWTAAVAAAALVGFVVFVVVRGPSSSHQPGSAALALAPPATLAPGTAAPGFSLPALDGGASVSLSALRGMPVIVNFFASWCPDCRGELAAVATVARSSAGRVDVIGVDTNESSDAAATGLLAAAHAAYPVGLDDKAKVASAYLVQALPVSYYVDAQGRVVGASLGPQTVHSLQVWVARLEEGRGRRS